MIKTTLFRILNFVHSCLPRPRSGPGPAGRAAYLEFGAWDLVLPKGDLEIRMASSKLIRPV